MICDYARGSGRSELTIHSCHRGSVALILGPEEPMGQGGIPDSMAQAGYPSTTHLPSHMRVDAYASLGLVDTLFLIQGAILKSATIGAFELYPGKRNWSRTTTVDSVPVSTRPKTGSSRFEEDEHWMVSTEDFANHRSGTHRPLGAASPLLDSNRLGSLPSM
ncbi:hypothetical protein I204_00273 [Kwoniella mangroviensis CBS 8886]|nr:hypothetical protein I204_00273 [Kwoniella mangroviensis CBS 8886]